MKLVKTLLFILLLMLASWCRCAEIHDAALQGDLAKVRDLLAKDPSLLNAKGRNEKAPLHWAAQGGHLEMAKYLIARARPSTSRTFRRKRRWSTPPRAAS